MWCVNKLTAFGVSRFYYLVSLFLVYTKISVSFTFVFQRIIFFCYRFSFRSSARLSFAVSWYIVIFLYFVYLFTLLGWLLVMLIDFSLFLFQVLSVESVSFLFSFCISCRFTNVCFFFFSLASYRIWLFIHGGSVSMRCLSGPLYDMAVGYSPYDSRPSYLHSVPLVTL